MGKPCSKKTAFDDFTCGHAVHGDSSKQNLHVRAAAAPPIRRTERGSTPRQTIRVRECARARPPRHLFRGSRPPGCPARRRPPRSRCPAARSRCTPSTTGRRRSPPRRCASTRRRRRRRLPAGRASGGAGAVRPSGSWRARATTWRGRGVVDDTDNSRGPEVGEGGGGGCRTFGMPSNTQRKPGNARNRSQVDRSRGRRRPAPRPGRPAPTCPQAHGRRAVLHVGAPEAQLPVHVVPPAPQAAAARHRAGVVFSPRDRGDGGDCSGARPAE